MKQFLRSLRQEEDGVAIVEAAMLFPIMLTLFMGMYDLGNGILLNQKVITASQVTADLIARQEAIDDATLSEFITAGELAMDPMPVGRFGVDVASIQFEGLIPCVRWRETRNMSPNTGMLTRVDGLGRDGDGVLVVTTQYDFRPYFSGFLFSNFTIQEEAFLRGRKSPYIRHLGRSNTSC